MRAKQRSKTRRQPHATGKRQRKTPAISERIFAKELASLYPMPESTAIDAVRFLRESLIAHMLKGDRVHLTGIGCFYLKKLKARTFNNLNGGPPIHIGEHWHPAFTPSPVLKQKIRKDAV